MTVEETLPSGPKLVKMVAAVVVGFGFGTVLSGGTTTVPALGAVPSVALGAVGVVAGGLLYRFGPRLFGTTGCGCSGDCDCA